MDAQRRGPNRVTSRSVPGGGQSEGENASIKTSSEAFTGTINGNGVTLTVDKGSLEGNQALSGVVTPEGFDLTFQGTHHNLITIDFASGGISEYNAAVRELETSISPTRGRLVGSDCETILGPGGRFAITAGSGVGCEEARQVFADLFAGKGESERGGLHTAVDGWWCGIETGGRWCRRSDSSIEAIAE